MISKVAENRNVPIKAVKIWDLEDSRKADGALPEKTDLRGEIHPTWSATRDTGTADSRSRHCGACV